MFAAKPKLKEKVEEKQKKFEDKECQTHCDFTTAVPENQELIYKTLQKGAEELWEINESMSSQHFILIIYFNILQLV